MTNSQRQARARQCFLHWVMQTTQTESESPNEPGEMAATNAIIREGMVIRDDFFLGRRFVTEGYDAIWFIEEDELKVFDSQGSVIQVMHREEMDDAAEKYEAYTASLKNNGADSDNGVDSSGNTLPIHANKHHTPIADVAAPSHRHRSDDRKAA